MMPELSSLRYLIAWGKGKGCSRNVGVSAGSSDRPPPSEYNVTIRLLGSAGSGRKSTMSLKTLFTHAPPPATSPNSQSTRCPGIGATPVLVVTVLLLPDPPLSSRLMISCGSTADIEEPYAATGSD